MNHFVSVIIPVFNEEATVQELFDKVTKSLDDSGHGSYEIIFVNDGSQDASRKILEELRKNYPEIVKIRSFRRNRGKAEALNEGFLQARGDVWVTMDADLQDDPKEIPKLIAKLGEGYDLVSGWKVDRKDPWTKTLPSSLFNRVTRIASGVQIHDFNCGLKAYRAEAASNLSLYGDLHRYIPVLLAAEGYRIAEVPVRHFPREHGTSKYGWKRFLKGALDLATVIVLTRYLRRPGHFFGGLGFLFGSMGFVILLFLSMQKIFWGINIGMRPLFFFGILLFLLGVQLVSTGLLGELIQMNLQKKSRLRGGDGDKGL